MVITWVGNVIPYIQSSLMYHPTLFASEKDVCGPGIARYLRLKKSELRLLQTQKSLSLGVQFHISSHISEQCSKYIYIIYTCIYKYIHIYAASVFGLLSLGFESS